MGVKVRKRKVTYRYLMLGFLTIMTFLSMAIAACEKNDEHQREVYDKAYAQNRSLAEKGDAEAQYNLGLIYDKGMGVITSYSIHYTKLYDGCQVARPSSRARDSNS